MRTENDSAYEVIAESITAGLTVQLVKNFQNVHFLRFCCADGKKPTVSAPLHSDPVALAEARDLFPDSLPFAGLPVDAT
ncbi:MAG: hypothetical protein WBG50_27065 [Desulfomonilaceae bacterium]